MARPISVELVGDAPGQFDPRGPYWTARAAVLHGIAHHQRALAGIERRGGKTAATTRAIAGHRAALADLWALDKLLMDAWSAAQGPRTCPDDGACHHGCTGSGCFRVLFCEPLSGVYPDDEWPGSIVQSYSAPLDTVDAILVGGGERADQV